MSFTPLTDSQRLEIYNRYVGIPWVKGGNTIAGADCWGLFTLASNDVHGVIVKEYIGSTVTGNELSGIIETQLASENWHESSLPRDGDLAVMYDKGTRRPGHMGMFIGNGLILHSPDHDGSPVKLITSSIHPVRLLKNIFHKIEFYRYDNDTE